MHTALPDKMRLLDFARGRFLLDVGCGSGDFMEHALNAGFEAFGVDPALESILRSREAVGDERVREAYANELELINDRFAYDTVIMSSVLHEVFSYGNRTGKIGKLTSLRDAIQSAADVLMPGGRLIIRDGVRARGWHASMTVDDNEAVERFIRESPFAYDLWQGGNLDRYIHFSRSRRGEHPNLWFGKPSDLMEFAFTYVWGENSFEREVQEFYGVHDRNNYRQFVERRGFKMVHYEDYIQQGYVDHLQGKVEFHSMPFPKTNAIWVYEKI